MTYLVTPMPHMEYQRLLGGYIPGLIDPTCGRYCLKSLLKYWHEKKTGAHVTRLTIDKPAKTVSDWIGFDPHDDYQGAADILVESYTKPTSKASWEQKLRQAGPIIISGSGIGTAARFVGHYILLVGINPDSDTETFYYLDPLVGNEVRTSPWTMQDSITNILVHATSDIQQKLDHGHRYFLTV